MNDFAILIGRKRALIALASSVVFLGIALHGFVSPRAAVSRRGPGAVAGLLLLIIYFTVTSILAWLVTVSGCIAERVYFGFCACSATFGLLRALFGDAALPAAQYLRVLMLTCAVLLGAIVALRLHPNAEHKSISA